MALINPIEKKRKSISYNLTVRGDLDDELQLALAFVQETALQGEETLTLQRLMVEILKKALQDNRKLIDGFEKKERLESYTISVPGEINDILETAFAREKARFDAEDATLPKFIVQVLLKALKDDKAFKNWKRERAKNGAKMVTVAPNNGSEKEEKLTENEQNDSLTPSESLSFGGSDHDLFSRS